MAFFKKKEKNQQDAQDENIVDLAKNQSTEENSVNTDSKKEVLEEADMFSSGEEKIDRADGRTPSELADEVIDYFTQVDPIKLNMLERGKLNKDSFVQEVHQYIENKVTTDEALHEQIFNAFESFIWRYDIVDELIDDPEISDIKIYDWEHIRVQRLGHRETSDVHFRNPRHFKKFVEHTAIKNKISISDQNALQNFVDKKSSDKAILRFNITTPFVNSDEGYLLSIRKIPKEKYTTEDLIRLGMMTQEQADYFKESVKTAGGILVAGKGGSGKTTLMNWALDYIPEDRSGLVIQENEELFSNHPDLAFQHTVMNRGEGKIEYTLGDLARNGLLMDIDYFIIGEIKGAEALYLLNAVYTGAKGWASVHGASATEAMKKLVDYIKYNSDYSQEEALQMLIHLDTVVFMEKFKVKEVAEIERYNPETKDFDYKKIF